MTKIVKPTINNLIEINNLAKQVQQLHVNWNPDLYLNIDEVIGNEELENLINNDEIYISKIDNKIVGYVTFEIKKQNINIMRDRKIIKINALCVDENYRNRGIGTELLNIVRNTGIRLNCTDMSLSVNSNNQTAINLYEEYGMNKQNISYNLKLLQPEKADVYDRNKNKTGKIFLRQEGASLNSGEFIITVTAWVVNNDGKILMTQRRLDKVKGGMWEPTTGLVKSGETSIQGVLRELSEEIGLILNENEVEQIKEIVEERDDLNFFRDIYLVKKNIPIEDVIFKDGEVINAKYVSIFGIYYLIKIKLNKLKHIKSSRRERQE